MSYIRRSEISDTSITLVGDSTFSLTKAEVLDYYNNHNKNRTIAWLKETIVTALGVENIKDSNITIELNADTKWVSDIIITSD